jgi:hypothetical protein
MHLSKITSLALLSILARRTAAAEAYAYVCYGCDCDSFETIGSEASCQNLSSGAAALGLSGTLLQCTGYTGYDCTGSQQTVGVDPFQSWGCTDSNIGWIYSMSCGN